MPDQTARNQFVFRPAALAAPLACALAGAIVYQFFGNATQGYIHSRSLFYWWGSQWFDPGAETQHGSLILLASVGLFWRNLRIHACSSGSACEPAGGAALVAMLTGLVLHLAGYAMQQSRVSIGGLLFFVWGLLVLVGGRRWGRAAGFPLVFMVLAVPVNFVDTLGFQLRMVVTDSTYAIAQVGGVRLLRNGTQLFSPDGRFQYDVAAACSGIRSLVALLALALLVGYLNFRSWVAWLVLVVAGVPYVVAGNIGRVLAVVWAGERFGQRGGERLHDGLGVLVFLAVTVMLLVTVSVMRRVGFKAARESIGPFEGRSETVRPWWVAVVTVVMAIVVCWVAARLDARAPQAVAGVKLQEGGASPVGLPGFIGTEWIGQSVDVTAVERAVLPADTGYARRNYLFLGDRRQQVFFSIVLSGQDRTSIHRPELCLVGQGWTITNRARHEFAVGGGVVPVTLLTVEHAVVGAPAGSVPVRSLLAYWFVGGGGLEPTHFGMQMRDAYDRLRYLRADRWAYGLVQTVVINRDEATALARMQEVLAGVWPEIRCEARKP